MRNLTGEDSEKKIVRQNLQRNKKIGKSAAVIWPKGIQSQCGL